MEEDPCDQLPPAADAGLVENALQMLLNRVHGDDELVGDLRRRDALQDEPGDVLFAVGQPVGRHQQRVDPRRMSGFDDDGDPWFAAVDQPRAVQDDPAAVARQHSGEGDATELVRVLGTAQGPTGDGQQGGR